MSRSLSTLSGRDRIDNVVVFVSDAHRADYLPESVRRLGVTATAIAPSTFTASALPSLLSGQYPATHKVWLFDDRLDGRPPLLQSGPRDVGFDAESVWIELPSPEKPPLQIHTLDSERKLADLDPPFVHVVHDVGPHAPYGFENGEFESTKTFFREYGDDRSQLVDLYRQDCHNSANRFLDVYEQLRDRDLLEETLLIFTSDHGQCLGEQANGGRFGHGHPMCPETVEIPVTFAGAGLPEGHRLETLLSGTDVAPTALGALGETVSPAVDGRDLWTEAPPADRKLRSDVWQHLDVEVAGTERELTVYAATSVWNDTGGYVFHRDSRIERAAALLYDNLCRGYAPAWRGNLSAGKAATFLGWALSKRQSYGAPDFDLEEARRWLPGEFQRAAGGETDAGLSDRQAEQLRDLGYLQ